MGGVVSRGAKLSRYLGLHDVPWRHEISSYFMALFVNDKVLAFAGRSLSDAVVAL